MPQLLLQSFTEPRIILKLMLLINRLLATACGEINNVWLEGAFAPNFCFDLLAKLTWEEGILPLTPARIILCSHSAAKAGKELKVEQAVKEFKSLSLPIIRASMVSPPYICAPVVDRMEQPLPGRENMDMAVRDSISSKILTDS